MLKVAERALSVPSEAGWLYLVVRSCPLVSAPSSLRGQSVIETYAQAAFGRMESLPMCFVIHFLGCEALRLTREHANRDQTSKLRPLGLCSRGAHLKMRTASPPFVIAYSAAARWW